MENHFFVKSNPFNLFVFWAQKANAILRKKRNKYPIFILFRVTRYSMENYNDRTSTVKECLLYKLVNGIYENCSIAG